MWNKLVIEFRAGMRLTLACSCVLAGLLAAAITAAPGLRRHRPVLAILWFKGMLRAINVHVSVQGAATVPGSLQVANHVSWLDILVLGAAGTTRFVAKSEIERWPIVGRLATVMDTVFLPRGAHQSSQAAALVGECLSRGESVMVFPEATTTDGLRTRHFHARFFAASINSGRPVQPFVLQYCVPGGDYMAVPYIGDMRFSQSLYALLQQPRIEARVVRQPPVETDNKDRKTLACAARDSIMTGLAQSAMPAHEGRAGNTMTESV